MLAMFALLSCWLHLAPCPLLRVSLPQCQWGDACVWVDQQRTKRWQEQAGWSRCRTGQTLSGFKNSSKLKSRSQNTVRIVWESSELSKSGAPGCYLWRSYCVTLSSSLHLWVIALLPQLQNERYSNTYFIHEGIMRCNFVSNWMQENIFFCAVKAAMQWSGPPNACLWLSSSTSRGCFVPPKCSRKYLKIWDSCEKFLWATTWPLCESITVVGL